jgi:hypothetical protein
LKVGVIAAPFKGGWTRLPKFYATLSDSSARTNNSNRIKVLSDKKGF